MLSSRDESESDENNEGGGAVKVGRRTIGIGKLSLLVP